MRCIYFSTLVLSLLCACSILRANPATEICYSPDQSSALATPPTNATVFTCPLAGAKTIVELAGLGLQVVSLKPIANAATAMTRQQLVVRRGVLIHANGFER